jgi:peptidoglycan/LPS O-acetylase OafA/YrhL
LNGILQGINNITGVLGIPNATASVAPNATTSAVLNASASADVSTWSRRVENANVGIFMRLVVLAFVLPAVANTMQDANAWPRPTESWTGFRFILAVWVFLEHVGVNPACGGGAFIVLSGAVVTLSDKKGFHSCLDCLSFWAKRYARILPAYWCFISLSLASGLVFPGLPAEYPPRAQGTPWNPILEFFSMPFTHPLRFFCLTCWTGRLDPTWFVSTIAFLYLFYPLLSLMFNQIGTKAKPRIAWMVFFIAYGLQWLICLTILWTQPQIPQCNSNHFARVVFGWTTLAYQNPVCRVSEFVMGCMIAHLLLSIKHTGGLSDRCSSVIGLGTDILFVLIVAYPFFAAYMFNLFELLHNPVRDLGLCNHFYAIADRMDLMSIVWSFLLLGLGLAPAYTHTGKILQTRLALGLGNCAYGIYLYSYYVLIPMGCFVLPSGTGGKCSVMELVTAFCTILICAALSYYGLEIWITYLVRRLLTISIGECQDESKGEVASPRSPREFSDPRRGSAPWALPSSTG